MDTMRCAAWLVIALCARRAIADDAPAPSPDPPTTPTPALDPAAPDEVIVVEAHAPEPAEVRVPAAQLREVPGALGDPVRAVTALPGVVPTAENRPEVYIRGAPPGNTGFFLDGVRVPLLFHGGVVSSVMSAALVDAIDFYASAAPARYGGVAGGTIEIETAAPARRPRGDVTVKAYEAGGLVESPVADGRGDVLAAARVGYPQLVTSLVSAADIKIAYWDYQARAAWALGDHDRVSVFAFGSHDRISENEAEGPEPDRFVEQLASDFHRVDLRYDHTDGASRLRAAVTGGWGAQGAGGIAVHDLMYGARVEGETRLAATVLGRAGVQLQRDVYRLDPGSSSEDPAKMSPASADPAPRNATVGGYADLVWDARDDLRLTPGLRVDLYQSTRAVDGASGSIPVVEPRLGARWRVRPELSVLVSAGLAHQYPLLRVASAPPTAVSVPGFWPGKRQLQRSGQASAGLEWLMPGAVTASVTGFASVTYGLTDLPRKCGMLRTGTPDMPGPVVTDCGDATSTGTAYGVELSLRRPLTERLAGWLSYTLSRATEAYAGATGARTLLSSFDRTHVASASLAYQISAGWRAGARIVAYSGAPFLTPSSPNGPAPYQFRLPWFERVDLRAERRWSLAHGRSISLVLDLLNATLSRERTSVTCGSPTAPLDTACTVHAGNLFVVPSIGIEGTL